MQRWQERGFGFRLDDDSLLTHVCWADNIALIATDEHQWRIMVQELWGHIRRHGMELKPSASEVIVAKETVALRNYAPEQFVTFF